MSQLWDRFIDPTNFHNAWLKVASNMGCAGVDGESIPQFSEQVNSNLEHLRKRLQTERYYPLPLRQILIPKDETSWRTLRIPTVRDRIIQQAMLNILHPLLEPQFEDNSFAYRPGRSHQMAVRKVESWHHHGYKWVLDADLVSFFDNVEHPRMLAEIKERLKDNEFIRLLKIWIETSISTHEGILLPKKGIPQGAVISPILANIYLDDFDELCEQHNYKLVRYADDFIILSHTLKQLEAIYLNISQWFSSIGLQLNPTKTRITSFEQGFKFLGHIFIKDLIVPSQKPIIHSEKQITSDTPFRIFYHDLPLKKTALQEALITSLQQEKKPISPPLYVLLGYDIRPPSPCKIISNEIIWEAKMKTLYLVDQGSKLCKENQRFIINKPDGSSVEILIRDIDCILSFGTIHITPSVTSVCLEERIPVVYLSQLGDYKGHLWSGEQRHLTVEIAQFQKLTDEQFQIDMARSIILGKLSNSRQLLLRLNRKRKSPHVSEIVNGIDMDRRSLHNCQTLEQLRGYEGSSARRYYSVFGELITNSGFCFVHRKRRPPPDPVNSLLSYGYTLLFSNVLSLILAEGLHPYLGNLHRSDRHAPHLAFDLMEEFRSPIVDSLVLQLINRQILKPTDFTWPDEEGGIYLEKPAQRVFLSEFEKRISSKTSHPDLQNQVTYRRAIQLQIQRYKQALLQGIPYQPFLRAV